MGIYTLVDFFDPSWFPINFNPLLLYPRRKLSRPVLLYNSQKRYRQIFTRQIICSGKKEFLENVRNSAFPSIPLKLSLKYAVPVLWRYNRVGAESTWKRKNESKRRNKIFPLMPLFPRKSCLKISSIPLNLVNFVRAQIIERIARAKISGKRRIKFFSFEASFSRKSALNVSFVKNCLMYSMNVQTRFPQKRNILETKFYSVHSRLIFALYLENLLSVIHFCQG